MYSFLTRADVLPSSSTINMTFVANIFSPKYEPVTPICFARATLLPWLSIIDFTDRGYFSA